MKHLTPALCGLALDLLLADPEGMPHPVVYMGKAISTLEGFLRPRENGRQGKSWRRFCPWGPLRSAAARAVWPDGYIRRRASCWRPCGAGSRWR